VRAGSREEDAGDRRRNIFPFDIVKDPANDRLELIFSQSLDGAQLTAR